MDVDAYVAAHWAEWERLGALVRRRRLSGADADELVELYQRVATHLSVLRSAAPDPSLSVHLSLLLARARARAAGTRTSTWRSVGGFFAERLPAALFRLRWWWLGMVAVNALVVAVMMLWLREHPGVEQSMLSPEEIDRLVNHDFADYYSEHSASSFAALVWTNNVWVSVQCLAFGVLGLPVLWVMLLNSANLAVIGSIMTRHGHGAEFWGLILPHGLLELTAVFLAGGVGLRLCWAWIAPGDRSRAQSLAREGRTAATVALGLVMMLAVSGMIEAFVTPSGLGTAARIGIGVAAETAFLAYVLVVGRAAVARGHDGDLAPHLLDDRVATQA
ncbi:MAG: stage II sporulation protein M [Nocardioides sp.]|uniref:stage II sporulation protein M n=1 Tax=Nocardioides sp. TaxID=35761 RepID=UPI0039E5D28E